MKRISSWWLLAVVGCGEQTVIHPGAVQVLTPETSGDVGEPTVDVDAVVVAAATAENPDEILLGIGVRTVGGPAALTAFSNFIQIKLQNGPEIRQATVERHDSVDDTIVEGFDESGLVYERRPWGHFFVVPVPQAWLPFGSATFDVETGFLATEGSTFEQDTLDAGPASLPEVELIEPEAILDEIEEVIVPA
jgi:hypothetical protein